jgi:hypothetical protein
VIDTNYNATTTTPNQENTMRQLRLVLDVTFNDNGVAEETLRQLLDNLLMHAISHGLLTGETEAEVESYTHRVENVPLPGDKIRVSKPLQKFFAAEIRNEDEGGIRPATLGNALDSWVQAPDDIREQWTGLRQVGKVERELRNLIKRYGPDVELASLIDTN